MKTQQFPIGSVPTTETLQRNLEELHSFAHTHDLKSVAPTARDGSVGDVWLYSNGTTFKIYVKFTEGWKSASLT